MIGQRCTHCKKQRYHHHGLNDACPVGKRSRTVGYTTFHPTNRFQARENARGGASERRKDRAVRRAVKSQPCRACGAKGTDWNPTDPCHLRSWGVTQSDHPMAMISLCRECHRVQHSEGWGYIFATYPHVEELVRSMGWEIHPDPFSKTRVILSHPEIP